jgi:uncharacterized protein (TIGR01777 family)
VRILLSGSSGLIGRRLRPILGAAGHEVVPLVRVGIARPRADGVLFDPSAADVAALGGFDAVIHLAGENIARRWTSARKASILASRGGFTAALMGALAKTSKPPGHVLSASATGYYGSRPDGAVTESAASGDGFLGRVCREWEAAAALAEADPRPRLAILRLGVVLTPEGGALAKMLPAFRLGLGGRIGNGKQFMSWISLPDALAAILHVLETPGLVGPVNLTAPEPVTNRQFTRALATALHRPALLPVPAFALKAVFGEMARETVLSDQRVLPAKLLASGYAFRHPTIEAALRDLLSDN